ncbi:MAG: NAD-binding protein, partial [Dehalococcoidia bacterium]
LDLDKMVEVMTAGAASSWAMANLAPRAIKRDFAPGFKVSLQQKDLRLALEAARQGSIALPGTALTHQLYAAVEAEGHGDDGNQALVRALARLTNLNVGEGR